MCFFIAAAGLMTCLKAVDFFHSNLFNPTQALPTMKLLFMQLHNKFGSETFFNSSAADVKEMHDWLPQSDILKTVQWMLSYLHWQNPEGHLWPCFINAQRKIGLENLPI